MTISPTTPLEVLIAAREWLDDPTHWTRGAMWRDRRCNNTETKSRVRSTCAVGALYFVAGCASPTTDSTRVRLARGASTMLASFVSNEDVSLFNDDRTTTHADVLALFDRVIAATQEDA